MTNNKDDMTKCSYRFRSVNEKLTRETERINKLDMLGLIKRLETTTGIRNIETMFEKDQLKHLNAILLLQSINHDMSIAMCKCG